MTTIEKQKLKDQVQYLEAQNKVMRVLSSSKGFYECYFQMLKYSKTKKKAFTRVNKLYFQLFGSKRYSSFSVFSEMVKPQ
jgi:hypothetical protein